MRPDVPNTDSVTVQIDLDDPPSSSAETTAKTLDDWDEDSTPVQTNVNTDVDDTNLKFLKKFPFLHHLMILDLDRISTLARSWDFLTPPQPGQPIPHLSPVPMLYPKA